MGRIRENISVKNDNIWTLFDSGARHTYVIKKVANKLKTSSYDEVENISLGGKVHKVRMDCILNCKIENLPIRVKARVLDEIGLDEDGKNIEVLFGALAMQKWGIKLDLENEKLDMSNYPKEFLEFVDLL